MYIYIYLCTYIYLHIHVYLYVHDENALTNSILSFEPPSNALLVCGCGVVEGVGVGWLLGWV